MSRLRRKSVSSPKAQATISSFFSQAQSSATKEKRKKRPGSPIDLTIDSDDNTPAANKRPRTTSSFFSMKRGSSTQTAGAGPSEARIRHGGVAEQWRFDPRSSSEEPRSAADGTQQKKLHEKAKKILLGNKNVFSRSQSDDKEMGVDALDEVEDGSDKAAELESSGDESDPQFSNLLQMFANSKSKKKGKRKATAPSSRQKKIEEVGPSGQTYTALELQVRELKERHPGVVLMVEVGYKIRFFGEDAKIASKELGIVCFPHRNFLNAMIPLHRRDVHLKKLLSKGYKIGIVEQTETAALKKVGDNRNELFSRKMTHLYTSVTYVDEMDSVDDLDPTSAPSLICLTEELKGGMGTDEHVRIGMIAISPSTGDVVWDEFDDNHMRTELETRLVHTKPYEILLPNDHLSRPSEKMIAYFAEHTHTDHKIRLERFNANISYTEAFSFLTNFFTDKSNSAVASENANSEKLVAAVAAFPNLVLLALAHSVKYLSNFNVEDALRETKFFAKFAERTHMLLNGNTLTNLEIYRNETDYSTRGSLMWILDHTSTKFGARMLRSWVGRPLVDLRILKDRIDAVEEILLDKTPKLTVLRELLKRLPDLAKGLCRIQYGKCTPQELSILLPSFNKIATAFQPVNDPEEMPFKSKVLTDVIATLPKLREPIRGLMNTISLKMAKEGKKEQMWTDPDKYPDIDSLTVSIQIIESELVDELRNIRKVLKKPALAYSTWNGEEYLVEVDKSENRDIPVKWFLVSSTKKVRRYHTPEVKEKLQQRAQLKEALDTAAKQAYSLFLQEIAQSHYGILRETVNKLATADCLLSLALVALQEGYVRPEFTQNDTLEIVEGRHPMVEALRSDPFVPNSVSMGAGRPKNKIITGPNMGGKSSVVRMVALCAIMAQIGSYVPTKFMKIGLLDGILTRMGASDELARGRSTFMVEMQETSDILQIATPRTLVILDELGRGTSTFDGMAIAGAVLEHLVRIIKCNTLFITHYPQVAVELERRFPSDVENLHMGFTEDTRIDGTREVTFLYRLTSGITTESFGVECARLAGLPETVLQVATARSQCMRESIEARVRRNRIRKCVRLIRQSLRTPPEEATLTLGELDVIVRSMGISGSPIYSV
ncbi:hypothetical protein AcV7_009281 [Taiwanofungus camphoratus]|nr:hypothetical protein AcV7_009281 [Antrodia cinnamomea]